MWIGFTVYPMIYYITNRSEALIQNETTATVEQHYTQYLDNVCEFILFRLTMYLYFGNIRKTMLVIKT